MRSEERCTDDRQARVGLESFRGAAPGPVLGSRDEAGPQRLLLNLAARTQQVGGSPEAQELGRCDGVPCGQRVPLERTPALHVGMGYPGRQSGDAVRVSRACDNMPMGGHEAVRNESDGIPAEALAQNREKPAIVVRPEQRVGAPRPTLHDVKEILRSGLLAGIRHVTTSPGAEERSKPDAASAGHSTGAPRSC